MISQKETLFGRYLTNHLSWLVIIAVFFTVIRSYGSVNVSDSLQSSVERFDQLNVSFNKFLPADADTALIIADKMIDLASSMEIGREAIAYYKRGVALSHLQKYNDAQIAFRRSINTSDIVNDKKTKAFANEALGNIYDKEAKFREAIVYYRRSKQSFIEANFIGFTANSNNYIAADFYAIGKYDSALVYTLDNIHIREKIHDNKITLDSYRQVAKLYSQLHNYKDAYHYLLEGIEYAELVNDRYSLANLYCSTGELFIQNNLNENIAIDYLIEARGLYLTLNPKYDISFINLFIGDAYCSMGNDSLALKYFTSVINSKATGENNMHSKAYYKTAMLYHKQGLYDSALVYFKKSIDAISKDCPEINKFQPLVESARTYIVVGKYTLAYNLLKKAKSLAEKSAVSPEIVIANEAMAQFFLKQNNMDSALVYYNEAYELSESIGLQKKALNNAKALSHIYYSMHNYKMSADLSNIASNRANELEQINKSDELAKLEMKLEIDKNEQARNLELQASSFEIKRQKIIRNYIIAGAVMLVLIVFLLFLLYRNKQKQNELLAVQKEEIREMSRRLHETDRNKLLFFTNISHEIRTPLTLIRFPIEQMLHSSNVPGESKELLELALKNTSKLQQIVNQILDLRRLDDLKFELCLSDFDLVEVLKEITSSFESLCHKNQCKFVLESNITSAIVRQDRERLVTILNNLLSNAFKYNRREGEVVLFSELTEKSIKIIIADTGKGIAEEHLGMLFDRYYQVNNSSSTEGSGIGLAYVKELIGLMRGSIKITSKVDEGTTITIEIPNSYVEFCDKVPFRMEIKPKPNLVSLPDLIGPDQEATGSKRLLIIEDNNDLRIFIENMFSPFYQILCADNGKKGLKLALQYNPDLIISDIMMPEMQGDELCQILKNDIQTSHIPVILLTAKDGRKSQLNGYECGADDYIVKPFDSEMLIQKVKNILMTQANAKKLFSFSNSEVRGNLAYTDIDRDLLKKCVTLVNDNVDNSGFTVELLATELGLSRKTLLRKFKALTDKTPSELIRHTRMSQAAILLREKKLRVTEVANMVGYEDAERFSNAFKQFHGKSPSVYS